MLDVVPRIHVNRIIKPPYNRRFRFQADELSCPPSAAIDGNTDLESDAKKIDKKRKISSASGHNLPVMA